MKKNDLLFLITVFLIITPLILWEKSFNAYIEFNKEHGMITSFIKFGILATLGEIIGLRIKTGTYFQKNFGILPKIIIWGFLGLTIKIAFIIFATGTPFFLSYMGIENAATLMKGNLNGLKIGVAFAISVAMNLFYAPVMMTFHKISDSHVKNYNGRLKCLIVPIDFVAILNKIDWNSHWNFVLKKTIPLFWIPAHTLTFLLPQEFQVLFAALLSILLGLILAIATMKSENKL